MMYQEPKNFQKEFIIRTKENLKKLDSCEDSYGITQFINSMLGLLVVPREKCWDEIATLGMEIKSLQKIQSRCENWSKDTDPKGLQNIIKRIRNAVCHGHLVFEAEEDPYGRVGNEIKRIVFEDYKPNTNILNFKAEIEVDLLKEFVLEVADAILNMK